MREVARAASLRGTRTVFIDNREDNKQPICHSVARISIDVTIARHDSVELKNASVLAGLSSRMLLSKVLAGRAIGNLSLNHSGIVVVLLTLILCAQKSHVIRIFHLSCCYHCIANC